jgi:hypothetical protein
MSKIWGYYNNKLDKTWYSSSNIKYSECYDNENSLKTLRVVFNNGTQYLYEKVNVRDYLLFREDESQGKALNKYIKAKDYEYQKIEDVNIEDIDNELEFRTKNGIFLFYHDKKLTMKNNIDEVIFEEDIELDDKTFNVICKLITSLGREIYVDADIDNKEEKIIEKAPF